MGRFCWNEFLAGASSVWASCCGLLNEVMGTGAVRGQQPGFGAGAGPFRFAPSAGYSTYPPNSSGTPGLVCRACGQAFSVFRRKYVCCDCKKNFCSFCSVVQENLRICATCHLLKATAFHRARLMRLRVRDLRQYLRLRNISTDTCREKEDLVDLVLGHRDVEAVEEDEEEEEDDDEEEEEDEEEAGDPNTASLLSRSHRTPTPPSTQPASELSAASPEESHSRSESPDGNQDSGDITPVPLLNSDSSEQTPQTSPQTRDGARASLSDISSARDIKGLSVRQLKEILARNFVNYSGCCEKWELVERVSRLYREKEKNSKSLMAFPSSICNGAIRDGEKCPLTLQDDNLCRICMDAVIDCVLLECGHLVTCTSCGKRMNQCPICRQYVVRAVHVFKC
ncbi:E3 ubiquitin-protein ligase RNF34 isoform X1 [Fundulus heteroclitus]|uniref:E3 ubiquitin-protein ligase RNF34 isoform X1 n=1 Tax=Fundulus heteroclitus TaxID=8078 RepID=UPI00165A50A7|nr:E3 ubiquitin-protein ligase RNF34 isoform X1 [Fundulus heteroclitus]